MDPSEINYQWTGRQPTIAPSEQGVSPPLLPREPRPGFPIGLAGVHLSIIIPVTWAHQFGFQFQIITGKHCFNYIITFYFYWNAAAEPNKFQMLFYNTGISVLGFSSLFQCFMFLFLGNGAREDSPSVQRYLHLKTIVAHSVLWPGMRFELGIIM